MGYYSFIFKIMAKKLNTGEVLNRINKKINELGNKILFLGFSNSFINTRSLKIKLLTWLLSIMGGLVK